jgi:hypothetical protein
MTQFDQRTLTNHLLYMSNKRKPRSEKIALGEARNPENRGGPQHASIVQVGALATNILHIFHQSSMWLCRPLQHFGFRWRGRQLLPAAPIH